MKYSFFSLASSMLLAVGTIAALGWAPAEAFTLLLEPSSSTENTGATAELNFDFVQSGAEVWLSLGMRNTTNGMTGLGATQSTLVGFAFDLPTGVGIAQYSAAASGFAKLWSNPSLNPYGSFTVGISPARNSFGGGNPREGLLAGQLTSVTFQLSGSGLTADSARQAFYRGFSSGSLRSAGRFQQVNAGGGSDKVLGRVLVAEEPPTKVPEPSSAVAIGLLGLGAIGLSGRRSRA